MSGRFVAISGTLEGVESNDEHRDLLREVVSDIAVDVVAVEWLTSDGWAAHARLEGATGLVGYLLTSLEWQEARFSEPHLSSFILTSTDRSNVRNALEMLARAVVAYVSGHYEFEGRRGLLGARTTLVIETSDGLWRVGKRSTQPPHLAE